MRKCIQTTMILVLRRWPMMPIEFAHAAEGQADRNRQAGQFNISTQRKSCLMNVLDELLQLVYFVFLIHLYTEYRYSSIDLSLAQPVTLM